MRVTDEQMGLWELEFLKCQTQGSLKRYIAKYKNVPENPFRQKAIAKLEEHKIPKARDSNKDIKLKDLHDVLPFLGYIGGIVLIGIVISASVDWLKEKSQTPYKPYVPVINPVNPIIPPDLTPNPDPQPNPTPTPSPTPYPNPYPSPYPNPTPTPSPTPEPDNSRWVEFYTNQYSEMERQAEREYNSLTNLGSRYMENGQLAGATGRNDSYIASQISSFRQLQHRMRDLRFEASKQGVNISQSYWETVDVH